MEQHSNAILAMLYKSDQVAAMEKIMRLPKPLGPVASRSTPKISDDEYERMTFAQRMQYAYQHSQDNIG